jgi:hypothetical protein
MNVQTITMPKAEALKAFREYRGSVRERATAEDIALVRGYKELSKGHALIDIGDVMKRIGTDSKFRPRVAVCRANAKFCWFTGSFNGSGFFAAKSQWPPKKERVQFPEGTFPFGTRVWQRSCWENNKDVGQGVLKTVVPLVPPPLQPKHSLANYHILWEVESWEVDPPRDPILCRHLAGMLYAVIAQWDLSELERAILRGRIPD